MLLFSDGKQSSFPFYLWSLSAFQRLSFMDSAFWKTILSCYSPLYIHM